MNLIDSDILVCKAGYASQHREGDVFTIDPLPYALHIAKKKIELISELTECNTNYGFLSTPGDKTLFRLEYAKTQPYKGNRLSKCCKDGIEIKNLSETTFQYVCICCKKLSAQNGRPYYYNQIRDYLISYKNTTVVKGIEADDALAINNRLDAVMCSSDKDLQQVPGVHFNLDSNKLSTIDKFMGHFNFYKQVLTGDAADNIPGIKYVGDKKSRAILADCKNEKEMYINCKKAYKERSGKDDYLEYLHEMCSLIYLKRSYDDMWTEPK